MLCEKLKMKKDIFAYRMPHYGSISVCVLVKNGAKTLARALASIQDIATEIVVVDTCSTDDSVAVAQSFGAKVYYFEWCDSFAVARNYMDDQATCNWIFSLDADEVVAKRDLWRIKELTLQSQFANFLFPTRNYTRNPAMQGAQINHGDYVEGRGWTGFTISLKTRLYKNHIGLRWRGCWHELIDYEVARRRLLSREVDIPIHHYSDEICQSSAKEKQMFYLRLGEKKVMEEPHNPAAWWELAVAEHIVGYWYRSSQHAITAIEMGMTRPNDWFLMWHAYKNLGLMEKARLVYEKILCGLFPALTHKDPNLHTWEAVKVDSQPYF